MLDSRQKNLIIESFEKGYRIDSYGRCYNKNNIERSLSVNSSGYKCFTVKSKEFKNGTRLFVHRLQAYQKFGDKIFEKGIVVRHLNGDSLDNSWDNIAIGTHSDNMMDKSLECRINSSLIATRKMQNDIRSYEERCLIYEDLKNGLSYKEIMKKHNVSSKGTLSFMKNKSREYKEYMRVG